MTFFISQSLSKYLFSRYCLHFLQTSNTCPVFFRYLQGSAFLIEIIAQRLDRKQRQQSCLFWNAKPSMVSATLLINHRVKRSLPARRRCLVGRFFFFSSFLVPIAVPLGAFRFIVTHPWHCIVTVSTSLLRRRVYFPCYS